MQITQTVETTQMVETTVIKEKAASNWDDDGVFFAVVNENDNLIGICTSSLRARILSQAYSKETTRSSRVLQVRRDQIKL